MKKLTQVHTSSETHWVGNGFPVRSVFDYNRFGREMSPFLMMDYAAPHSFPPGKERRGVGAHPHKGFETVTLVYQGELEHRDSSGGGGTIGPGDVQWMTAGRGIVHDEYHSSGFALRGGTLQMVQLWVNLRAQNKGSDPGYQTLRQDQIPSVTLQDQESRLRIVAGEYNAVRGPARTYSHILLWDAAFRAGAETVLPIPNTYHAALFVLKGQLTSPQGEWGEGQLGLLSSEGAGFPVKALDQTQFLILGGEPIDEPIVGYGPFVMNSSEEIRQAVEQFQRGAMGRLP